MHPYRPKGLIGTVSDKTPNPKHKPVSTPTLNLDMSSEGTELREIDGIGNTNEEKLLGAGIKSITQLARQSPDDLQAIGIGEKRSKAICQQAQKLGVNVSTLGEVAEEQDNLDYISTGIAQLNDAMGGGLEPGFITGVSGEHKAGKTQLIFHLLVSAVEQTGKPAIYIETEPNRFQSQRIREIAAYNEDVYDKIYRIRAYSEDEDVDALKLQRNSYKAVKDEFNEVSLVAVDSFVANFRLSGRYEGRQDLKERGNEIARHLRSIQSIATSKDCPVLMTLQVMGNPEQYASKIKTWGGSLMHHTITCFIHMKQSKGELREIQLRGHPGKPDKEITVKITSDGIEAV